MNAAETFDVAHADADADADAAAAATDAEASDADADTAVDDDDAADADAVISFGGFLAECLPCFNATQGISRNKLTQQSFQPLEIEHCKNKQVLYKISFIRERNTGRIQTNPSVESETNPPATNILGALGRRWQHAFLSI